MKVQKQMVLILHNIRSAYNIGSIFRTADAAEVDKIILSGYSPTPLDKFENKRKDISKTALGAEDSIKWEYIKDIKCIIEKARKESFEICAIEQDKDSINYKNYKPKNKVAFIFGNEVKGISKRTLQRCDKIIEIPMRGKKESLNVSVSVGVILFQYI